MTPRKPVRTRDTVLVWVGIVFVLGVSCLGGLGLIADGVGGQRTLAQGPTGTFTPTDRKCSKDSCTWVGTFTSADSTVTEQDVELKDSETVRYTDRMPAVIDDVRLDDEATRPTAYTADYNWYGPIVKGTILSVVGLALAAFLMMMHRRHRSAAISS